MDTTTTNRTQKAYTATRNACKMCTPLGACVVFKGVRGCVPLIHGSQGCSTYIRRYMISHYKEPIDIASTNFSEEAAIFGGEKNFETAVINIIRQYKPEVIAVASTCLSETIGDDVDKMITRFIAMNQHMVLPHFVFAPTPSYKGNHMDGFHIATLRLIKSFARENKPGNHINIFPGFVSPQDLRVLKEVLNDFDLPFVMVPDYSETLDNPNWKEYKNISDGGTSAENIGKTASARASIEFGRVLEKTGEETAARFLEMNHLVKRYAIGLPIGVKETDRFFDTLSEISGKSLPEKYDKQRGRLIDAYIDGHKYVFGKKAVIYGDEDQVVGLVSFLEEIGLDIVLCASGGKSQWMKKILTEDIQIKSQADIMQGADFEEITEKCRAIKPDIIIGNSKGYYIARELGIPLVRVGFPIHDRIGGQRISHVSYAGTQELFDRITNAIIEYKQDHSPVGYKYM